MSGSTRPRISWSRRAADAIREPPPGATAVAIATVSTVLVLAVIGFVIVNAPGWSRVQETFFDGAVFAERFPQILAAFRKNLELFVAAQVLILIGGLFLAIMRGLPGPVFDTMPQLITTFTALSGSSCPKQRW